MSILAILAILFGLQIVLNTVLVFSVLALTEEVAEHERLLEDTVPYEDRIEAGHTPIMPDGSNPNQYGE